MKPRDIYTYNSNLNSRSPAKKVNGNAPHCMIVIEYDNGSRKEIFLGPEYSALNWSEKMRQQGAVAEIEEHLIKEEVKISRNTRPSRAGEQMAESFIETVHLLYLDDNALEYLQTFIQRLTQEFDRRKEERGEEAALPYNKNGRV